VKRRLENIFPARSCRFPNPWCLGCLWTTGSSQLHSCVFFTNSAVTAVH
ncbi:hypothetical protein LINPERPRIM_LOCUS632, partial [Linum perenne]